MSINRVVIIGRMTKDPEIRVTQSGEHVASFTLAVNRNYQSADGVQADYIPCVVWGKKAENTANYCNKGSQVGVSGAIRTRNYDNSNRQKVYVTEVVCDSVEFLDSKKNNNNNNQVPQDNFYNVQPVEHDPFQNENSFNSFDIMEDDIQF